ncbi:MAG: DUF5107 domain-containing protein [Planctomycetes bacterium]|nr:DUF5107 domain-containing protein [Planctomycetota bacterium]
MEPVCLRHAWRALARAWAIVLLAAPAALAGVRAYESRIGIPTYPWDPPVPHPYFSETDGRNIYPYPMLDNLSRERTERVWKTVILENEYLRVTFLPELGGRVHEVLDKTTSRPVFYVNHVIKPGLIGMCGAWISGGIEFNTGPTIHTVSAVIPVDVQILPPAEDGSQSVAVGEVERIYGTRWTVIVTLRPGRSFLEERIRIYNRTETVRPYYFWNCTAMPNTPGFRFVYPMTLGTDHAGRTFYTWPVSDGVDLSLGRDYRDASAIFAYGCDQDFFGSYDDDADRGVVAYADHHVLPGKKAWTWGHGGYGTMHQMDLTDDDGPYNEIQTGPLLTQAKLGRLDPNECVTWREWWYPVHGIGGFTFANRDLAVNATAEKGAIGLHVLGTGTWERAAIRAYKEGRLIGEGTCGISPRAPSHLEIGIEENEPPFHIEIASGQEILARFSVPLDIPVVRPPEPRPVGDAALDLARAGWDAYLSAHRPQAQDLFAKAVAKDGTCVAARTGLALLALRRDPADAAREARAALDADPDDGRARFVLAVAEYRSGDESAALADAMEAALDPAAAVPARALAGKILIRRRDHEAAIGVLSASGPWRCDPVCRNRLALALLRSGMRENAVAFARQSLLEDPLDAFARSILWLAESEPPGLELVRLAAGSAEAAVRLAAAYADIAEEAVALRLLQSLYVRTDGELEKGESPLPYYWAGYLADRLGQAPAERETFLARARALSARLVFPHRSESVPVLRWALDISPDDGKAALLLGHLLFSLGLHDEARAKWRKAAEQGAEPAIAYRALGMAKRKIDGDVQGAADLLRKAHDADPKDAIIARDLARTLMSLADGAEDPETRTRRIRAARDVLTSAMEAGEGRSDVVTLLATTHNRLGEYDRTARLLDRVRITIWEGAREAHNLFVEAHLAVGDAHLAAGRSQQALAEFDRALEYPENLATGKLEGDRFAHIQYRRGKALSALGRKDEAVEAWRKAAGEPPAKDPKIDEARAKAKEELDKIGVLAPSAAPIRSV